MAKSDINLIPKKKRIPLSVALGIIFGVAIFAILVFAGIALPRVALDMKQTKLNSLKQDLSAYSNVQTEYTQKMADFTTLQKQQANYKAFESTDLQTLELMKQILAAKPATITVINQSYTGETINLSGLATNDLEIARFEVSLRKTTLFSTIQIGSISGETGKRVYDFVLTTKGSAKAEGGTGK